MVAPRSLLDMEPDELERHLIEHGRRDRPREAARRMTLSRVTVGAAAGAGLTATSMSSGAATSLPWLVATKWVAIGIASGAVSIGAVDGWKHSNAPLREVPTLVESAPLAVNAGRPAEGANITPPTAETRLERVPDVPTARSRMEPVAHKATLPKAAPLEEPPAPIANVKPSIPPQAPSSLEQQLRLLDEARMALDAHAAPRALQALDEHAERFPSGSMRIEADALRIETWLALGRKEEARALGRSFLAAHPRSPTALRVQRLLDAANEPTKG
jgi:hypothetical protein